MGYEIEILEERERGTREWWDKIMYKRIKFSTFLLLTGTLVLVGLRFYLVACLWIIIWIFIVAFLFIAHQVGAATTCPYCYHVLTRRRVFWEFERVIPLGPSREGYLNITSRTISYSEQPQTLEIYKVKYRCNYCGRIYDRREPIKYYKYWFESIVRFLFL